MGRGLGLVEGQYRVLIVDDHALFRRGVRHLMEEIAGANCEVEEGSTLQDALQICSERQFDLVLMDLMMPGMNGVGGIAAIAEALPSAMIVVVSMIENPDDIRGAMGAGISGYIPKSSSPEIMRRAIELVMSGGIYLPPSLLQTPVRGNPIIDDDDEDVRIRIGEVTLTGRQLTVLKEMVKGESNKGIARTLDVSVSTVKAHVAAILKRLGVSNRT